MTETKTMVCIKCDTPMIIDEWNGWRWTCFHCDHLGRLATNEEVEKQEQEFIDSNQLSKK